MVEGGMGWGVDGMEATSGNARELSQCRKAL